MKSMSKKQVLIPRDLIWLQYNKYDEALKKKKSSDTINGVDSNKVQTNKLLLFFFIRCKIQVQTCGVEVYSNKFYTHSYVSFILTWWILNELSYVYSRENTVLSG